MFHEGDSLEKEEDELIEAVETNEKRPTQSR